MTAFSAKGKPDLVLVKDNAKSGPSHNLTGDPAVSRDVDWSILMARAQAGDGAAYHRLLAEVTPYIRSIVWRSMSNKSDAEDAVQDILLTIHAIRATYDPLRPFGPWLVAITNRRVIDHLRKQGRKRLRETLLDAEHEQVGDERVAGLERDDLHALQSAIAQLSPQQKQAIHLLKLKEMTLNEASSATGISITSLKVRTHRALKQLHKILTTRTSP